MALLGLQVWKCLDLDLLDGAELLAEQLVAHEDDGDSRYLLSYVQYRMQQYETAKTTSAPQITHLGCLWVNAMSHLKLGQCAEGASLLKAHRKLWDLDTNLPVIANSNGRGELTVAAFHLVLGKLEAARNLEQSSVEMAASAYLDPYLIENVLALARNCNVEVKSSQMFSRFEDPFLNGPSEVFIDTANSLNGTNSLNGANFVDESGASAPLQAATSTPRRQEAPAMLLSTPMPFRNAYSKLTPAFQTPSLHTPVQGVSAARSGFNRRPGHRTSVKRTADQSSLASLGRGLFASSPGASSSGLTGVLGLEALMNALHLLSQSQFNESYNMVQSLSLQIQQTPFVLQLKGRLLQEIGDYSGSLGNFEKLRYMQPDRTRGMEQMSTVMWHLKMEHQLSMLAAELTRKNSLTRLQWQSWCVLGNAFSARHDIQNAILCFKRSVKLQRSAVALTLMGYEHIANEELEHATQAFSDALKVDPQHYNAWYGLGSVQYSLGRYKDAEIYFDQAIKLNPNNAVLLCLMGAVLNERGHTDHALALYDRACLIDPKSLLPRFRKAETLLEHQKFAEALRELREIEHMAPGDPSIQVSIAQAYKGLGEGESAVQSFTKAQVLAPKSSAQLRKELDSI